MKPVTGLKSPFQICSHEQRTSKIFQEKQPKRSKYIIIEKSIIVYRLNKNLNLSKLWEYESINLIIYKKGVSERKNDHVMNFKSRSIFAFIIKMNARLRSLNFKLFQFVKTHLLTKLMKGQKYTKVSLLKALSKYFQKLETSKADKTSVVKLVWFDVNTWNLLFENANGQPLKKNKMLLNKNGMERIETEKITQIL